MKILNLIYTKIITTAILGVTLCLPTKVSAQTTLENPLQAGSLQDFLSQLVDAVVILSIPIIVFFIIYAGFTFVTSGGDTSKIEKAKKTALYTIIGAAIILGASLIASILEGTAANL